MRVGRPTLATNSPLSPSNTEVHEKTPSNTRFGAVRGAVEVTADAGGSVCRRVPGKLPSCMGAGRQRTAGNAFGWEAAPSRVRPSKSFPGGRRGAKPPASFADVVHESRATVTPSRPKRRSCLPSLDTQGTSCTHRPAVHVGGAWVREFREAVADALREQWPERARALLECGLGAIQLNCKCCSAPHLVPFRCGARTCSTCAPIAAAAIVDRIAARVAVHDVLMLGEPWDGQGSEQQRSWRLVTLTTRADADVEARFTPLTLRRQVRRVRKAFPRLWRSLDWGRQVRDSDTRRKRSRRDTSYVFALEVSPQGMVHVHALVYGEYIPQGKLEAAWGAAVREHARVDVRTVSDPEGVAGALREVLKYATKGEKGSRSQPERAAAVELAFRNVHRVGLGGAVRRVKLTELDGATEDVRGADLHNERALSCESCGVVGEWTWVGMVSRGIVAENGGFGLLARCGQPEPFASG